METLIENWPRLAGMAALLCLSAFFSGSETALFSLSREQLRHLKEGGSRAGNNVISLLSNPKRLLTSILFGNMVVNVLFYGTSASLSLKAAGDGHHVVAVAFGILTLFVLIVFGEVSPKMLAVSVARGFALRVAMPLRIFQQITLPICFLFSRMIDLISSLISGKKAAEPYITTEELKLLVEATAKQGAIDRQEHRMIRGVVDFRDVKVREIMVPRVDVVMHKLDDGKDKFLEMVRQTRHTRIPVYRDKIDNIVGIIYSRDALLYQGDLDKRIRPVAFVPEAMTVETLLRQLRERHAQMAVVVDEYGGTAGVVTVEDALEAIVGEIESEVGRWEGEPIKELSSTEYLLAGDLGIREWNELFGAQVSDPRLDTIGGFVTSLLGRVPREGDTVDYMNLTLTVRTVMKRRIGQIHLKLHPREKNAESPRPADSENSSE